MSGGGKDKDTYMIFRCFEKSFRFCKIFSYLLRLYVEHINVVNMGNKRINRLKIILAEKEKSNNWLAEQLGRDKATISKWCTNTSQPDIETFIRISKLLNVELADLVRIDEVNA